MSQTIELIGDEVVQLDEADTPTGPGRQERRRRCEALRELDELAGRAAERAR